MYDHLSEKVFGLLCIIVNTMNKKYLKKINNSYGWTFFFKHFEMKNKLSLFYKLFGKPSRFGSET